MPQGVTGQLTIHITTSMQHTALSSEENSATGNIYRIFFNEIWTFLRHADIHVNSHVDCSTLLTQVMNNQQQTTLLVQLVSIHSNCTEGLHYALENHALQVFSS